MIRRGTVGALALIVACWPHPAGAASHEVVIRNNFYAPASLAVAPGGTVTWRLVEGAHTVTSDLFDSGLIEDVGETFTFTTPDADVTILYHCKRHASMRGALVVGDGDPRPPSDVSVRSVPSGDFPTLDVALEDLHADRRYRIELAPGLYPAGLAITSSSLVRLPGQTRFPHFELTVRGTGSSPADVVLDGEGHATVVSVRVDGVRIENLTVRGGGFAGLHWRNVERFGAGDVVVGEAGRYGVRTEASRFGSLRRIVVSGASVAGVSVVDCEACDTIVDESDVSESLQGLAAENAGSVIVRRSTFRDNAAGVSMKTTGGTSAPGRGTHVYDNTIEASTNRSIPAPAPSSSLDLPVGAGVWLEGVSHASVHGNTISTSSFGVVVTGPAMSNRILGNTITDSVEADLAWDGVGADVCFAGNLDPAGAEVTSMPPAAEVVYGCSLAATVGVPYPVVWARLLEWGLG